MPFSEETYNLRIKLDTKNFQFSAAEIAKIETGLQPLRKVVRDFPVSDLYLTFYYHERNNDYKVDASLRLPKRILYTGDHDFDPYTAFRRCVRKLMMKVEGVIDSMENRSAIAKREKGTQHDVVPSHLPDGATLAGAVESGDYRRFREATSAYEEPLRKRIGRWIERYPNLTPKTSDLSIDDIVEEVFLNAFERFGDWPSSSVTLSDWLESLIDPSIKAIIQNPDAEMENIQFAKTLRAAPAKED